MATDVQRAVARALKVERLRKGLTDAVESVRKAAAADAAFDGGPCRYCGRTQAVMRDERGTITPGWYDNKTVCVDCYLEQRPLGFAVPDAEHRERVIRLMVREDVARRYHSNHLIEKAAFRWWSEIPGAKSHPTKRFAYTSGPELEQRLMPAENVSRYSIRQPCQRCGCDRLWTQDPDAPEMYTAHGMALVRSTNRQPTYTCHGCASLGPSDEDYRNGVAEALVGIRGRTRALTMGGTGTNKIFAPGRSYTEMLNIKLWRQTGAPASGVPFSYLDRKALREAAFRIVPKKDWSRPDLWDQLDWARQTRLHESTQAFTLRQRRVEGARERARRIAGEVQ